jgi:hypothetical protein
MNNFSQRYGYAPKCDITTIVEDAPYWLRLAFVKSVMNQFVHTESGNEPISVNELGQAISIRFHIVPDDAEEGYFAYNYVYACDWYRFYDLIELLAELVKSFEESKSEFYFSESDQAYFRVYGFDPYRGAVNKIFTEGNVGWRLSIAGSLALEKAPALQKRIDGTQQMLTDEYEPAREHYKKAIRFSSQRPLDPENSIKEIVSAIESVGRIMYPSTSTLGDVIKELRKANVISVQLISILEKFYAYASSEPAVRHGAPVLSKVSFDDAEFCLHVGTAMIRYLITCTKRTT